MSIPKTEGDDDYPVPLHLMEPTDPAERTRLLAEAGRGISNEKVAAWLLELAADRPAKAPCDP